MSSASGMIASTDSDLRTRNLLKVVGAMMRELHPQRYRLINVAPESRIERDLGIDSLERAELILRLEREFRLSLPARVIAEAETVRDLIDATEAADTKWVDRRVAPTVTLPFVSPARAATTLLEVLEWHSTRCPERLHVSVLENESEIVGSLTYGQLTDYAKRVAYGLIARDVLPGDRVALMLPTGIEFFIAFFGVLYAGGIPVPIYPPLRLSKLEEHLRRQIGILRNAGACILISAPEAMPLGSLLSAQIGTLRSIDTVATLQSQPRCPLPTPGDTNSVALIQYTSGSTGDPKGVVLTNANLLANVRSMGAVMAATSDDVFVSWLPLYHDMGLIGAWLGCLYFGARLYAMPPMCFLMRPESWLWAMHRYRATFSAAPNFGFELCLNKIPDSSLDGLDLTAVRMIANGAEPVSPETVRRFSSRFARYGFASTAMAPVYGLAECSVGLAFPPLGRGPVFDRVRRDRLSQKGLAEPAQPHDPSPIEFVSCGQPLPDHEIRIVDEVGREVGDRCEGRLEFRGPSATRGYFRNEIKTRGLFHDGWLDSGDRAYISGGDVFITGRIKDIIIRAGRHLYPQEIEEAVSRIEGVRKGGVAVFSAVDQHAGTEAVVVLAETREEDPGQRLFIKGSIQGVVTDIAGTPPDAIVLVPPRTVPKTSSGKLRRSSAKEMYLRGRIGPVERALWLQLLRLWLGGIRLRSERWVKRLGDLLYAGWWWGIVGCCLFFGAIACFLLPSLRWRWRMVRGLARACLRLTGIPLSITGSEWAKTEHTMLVFNHASYADAIVLAAIIPGEPIFVVKRELAHQLVSGTLLRRLGVLFLERRDFMGRIAAIQDVIRVAYSGRNLVFFPEGTFTRRPGISMFYLGAFKVAAEAKMAIAPGVIRGTRTMLRSDQWFPRWSEITVEIGPPIFPIGPDFDSAVRLRDEVHQWILKRSGEPDLAELVKPDAL